MNIKRGDILWPTDPRFFKLRKGYRNTGILIVTSVKGIGLYAYVYFYQLNNHEHDWEYPNLIKNFYKVL